MSEIAAMQKVEEALESLDDDGARKRVLDWACARYLGNLAATSAAGQIEHEDPDEKPKGKPKPKGKTGSGKKKGKAIPKLIKTLSFNPSGKQSGKSFAEEKKPTNAREKGVVAAYYCRDVLEVDAVTVDHVFSFFKAVGWPIPADLVNTLQQAGSAGWLDTSDSQNIVITAMGENLIEHTLPKA